MKTKIVLLGLGFVSLLLNSCGSSSSSDSTTPAPTTNIKYAQVSDFIGTYCATSCHSGATPSGSIDLSTYAGVKANAKEAASAISAKSMPPTSDDRHNAFQAETEGKANLLEYLKGGTPE